MKLVLVFVLLGIAFFNSPLVKAEEVRIVQVDSLGNKLYHKGYLVIQKDGRIIQTDNLGNKQYHKPQLVLTK